MFYLDHFKYLYKQRRDHYDRAKYQASPIQTLQVT